MDKNLKTILILYGTFALLALAFWAIVIGIVWHFVEKFW
jgi:hypothetical protein